MNHIQQRRALLRLANKDVLEDIQRVFRKVWIVQCSWNKRESKFGEEMNPYIVKDDDTHKLLSGDSLEEVMKRVFESEWADKVEDVRCFIQKVPLIVEKDQVREDDQLITKLDANSISFRDDNWGYE